jgi:hypothetical protein
MGGAPENSPPMGMVGSSLAQAKKELSKTNPEDNLEWTDEALDRIKRVPFFVRNMARKTVINFALEKGATLVDGKLMDEVREKVGM